MHAVQTMAIINITLFLRVSYSSMEDGKTERELDREGKEGGDGGGRDGDGDRVKGSKKRRKSSSGTVTVS